MITEISSSIKAILGLQRPLNTNYNICKNFYPRLEELVTYERWN